MLGYLGPVETMEHYCDGITTQRGSYGDGRKGFAIERIIWTAEEQAWSAVEDQDGYRSTPIFYCPFCGIQLKTLEPGS